MGKRCDAILARDEEEEDHTGRTDRRSVLHESQVARTMRFGTWYTLTHGGETAREIPRTRRDLSIESCLRMAPKNITQLTCRVAINNAVGFVSKLCVFRPVPHAQERNGVRVSGVCGLPTRLPKKPLCKTKVPMMRPANVPSYLLVAGDNYGSAGGGPRETGQEGREEKKSRGEKNLVWVSPICHSL